MFDIRGVEIQPGQIIVYPGRDGATMWLNVARVRYLLADGAGIAATKLLPVGPRNKIRITKGIDRVAVVLA